MIRQAQVLKIATNFNRVVIKDRGFSVGFTLIGYGDVKYGVSFTIEKSEMDKLPERLKKANNSVSMLCDKVSVAA